MNKKEKSIIADVETAAKLAGELAALYKSIAAKLCGLDGHKWAAKGEVLSDAQKHRNLADTYIRRSAALANAAAFRTGKTAASVGGIIGLLNERESFANENGVTL